MTKKKIVVLAALLIGINGFPMEDVTAAGDGPAEGIAGAKEGYKRPAEEWEAEEGVLQENGADGIIPAVSGNVPFVSGNMPTVSGNIPVGNALADIRTGMDALQMPEETAVVIDPWEIDGRGQVYSEQYTVRNEGNTAGMLVLSNLTCFSKGQEKAVIKTDKEGIHNGREKSVYIELVFENGDRMVFGQDDSRYIARLEPGEELVFRFAGEVNENAAGLWQDGDIAVSMECSWEMEKNGLEADSGMESVTEPETDSGNNQADAGTEEGEYGQKAFESTDMN